MLVVNAGSDDWNFQVRGLAEAVVSQVPGCTLSINREAPPDRRSYRVDFSLFRSLAPGHQPVATLAGTIGRLRDGLTAMGFSDRRFREGRHIRLHVLSEHAAAGRIGPDHPHAPRVTKRGQGSALGGVQGLCPIGVRIRLRGRRMLPLPLWEGAGGRGHAAKMLRARPLPPTPSHKGRGSSFAPRRLILTPMGQGPWPCFLHPIGLRGTAAPIGRQVALLLTGNRSAICLPSLGCTNAMTLGWPAILRATAVLSVAASCVLHPAHAAPAHEALVIGDGTSDPTAGAACLFALGARCLGGPAQRGISRWSSARTRPAAAPTRRSATQATSLPRRLARRRSFMSARMPRRSMTGRSCCRHRRTSPARPTC